MIARDRWWNDQSFLSGEGDVWPPRPRPINTGATPSDGGEPAVPPPTPPTAAPAAPAVEPFNYTTPAYTGPSSPGYRISNAPRFTAPRFHAPTAQDVLGDPGYQFRVGQGRQALEQSAAGRGVLRTGGTLRDIIEYGQNFASQEYANAFNRALQSYDREYQAAAGEYAPGFASWQTRSAAEQRQADLAFQRAWDEYVFGIQDELAREQMLLNAGAP